MIYTDDYAEHEQATIREAVGILEARIRRADAFTKPEAVKTYCRLQLAHEVDELFACLYLDNQHRLIAFEPLFRGTVDGAAVYPRVIVRRVLELNAAAVIFTHNHPSGVTEPSSADRRITERLREALALIEVRVLDHIIVGNAGEYSMAEHGLI